MISTAYNNKNATTIIDINDILTHLCSIKNGSILLDYKYFKPCARVENYGVILKHIIETIQTILREKDTFVIHINLQSLTLSDVEKYYSFIQIISETMKNTFPDKLEQCNIYNAPFIFSQVYRIISLFIDKKTQQKMKLVEENVDTAQVVERVEVF